MIDGADVVGAHADRRRLARVRYSPAGVTADDVIREEIAGLDPRRSVAVVTNDREVRRDVIAAGANVITSDALVDLALRLTPVTLVVRFQRASAAAVALPSRS